MQNMDELMDVQLGEHVFAATHACACNPLKTAHYPRDWVPENCAYTTQHSSPDYAQTNGAPSTAGISMPNGGLQVVDPSGTTYQAILHALESSTAESYAFADQSLLGDVFRGRWLSLPYVYNALKTLRWPGVHDAIWRDEQVKNMHYGLSPKPWDETEEMQAIRDERSAPNDWWWEVNDERVANDELHGITDRW
ncbi:nucleotide-diphospho-sugar transferase [Exidia glandulosa HHB12029]|uniref:Nucleotide-diphospho-sugar transferase n=1 Tax=Exidia glandulosa HHB12029 TaxID=1314781 RepID=A0A165ZK88_EXIGL|nr:nucleotide-diphospho-sugar transferase [Exidia glandulosa HHB12029]